MSERFDLTRWYWSVGGDQTQFYSSATGGFVPAADVTYQAWLTVGNVASPVDTLANLGGILAGLRLRPTDAGVLVAYQQALSGFLDDVVLRVLFNHENRIRTLAGQQQVTRAQFIAALAALL